MEDYSVLCKLGDGAQGVVYKVSHRETEEEYAMKIICCTDQSQVNLALQEIKVLLQLRHPHIVSYVDFFLVFNSAKLRREFEHIANKNGVVDPLQSIDGVGKGSLVPDPRASLRVFDVDMATPTKTPGTARKAAAPRGGAGEPSTNLLSDDVRAHWLAENEIAVCLVMELCGSGDMAGMVRETKSKMMETGKHPLTEPQVLAWMEQCAAALQFMHEKGFLHRDLKPTNVFFDAHRDVKIGDFGLAATMGNGGRRSAVGTPYYLAPERMLQQRYDGKVDVWGLGVVFWELLALREEPINSLVLENPGAVEKVVASVTKMGFSTRLAGLLRDMLQRQPERRPTPAAILQRLYTLSSGSPTLGASVSLFADMSCPKVPEALCNVCEVEAAAVFCEACHALFCPGCDRARHLHHSRQSHERSSMNGASTVLGPQQQQQQLTLSMSRTTSPQNLSDPSRSPRNSGSVPMPSNSPTAMHPRSASRNPSLEHNGGCGGSRAFSRLQHALNLPPGNSLSASDFSLTLSALPLHRGLVGSGPGSPMSGAGAAAATGAGDTVVRVPGDFPTLASAVAAVAQRRHVRKILVAGNTVHNAPLTLTRALPENIKIVGESPAPVLEVGDGPFALLCASGKGIVENFVIRHVGAAPASRKALADVTDKSNTPAAGSGKSAGATATAPSPRPTAVSITGGQWALRKCRISCVGGSGVTVGAPREARGDRPTLTNLDRDPNGSTSDEEEDNGEDESRRGNGAVDPVVSKCHFVDVVAAGVIVEEKARGLFEGNTFFGCGKYAFLIKPDSAARVRANRITDGSSEGIHCESAQGSFEYNLIAQNAGVGVVVKGAGATAVFRKNRVLNNAQVGFFCEEHAAPYITDNEICNNGRAGVLIRSKAAPKVSNNSIEGNKEAGVYVCKRGAGIIEENTIARNRNAGIIVTTGGNPHVIHNTLTKNAYEGIWVCQEGRGTFCDNDLRANARGPMDIDEACKVTWVGNREK